MGVTLGQSVGSVVAERIGRVRVFEGLGIDYCCHGATPLGEACLARGLDPDEVIGRIAEADRGANTDDATDYAALSPSALADHIELTHHAYLKEELPRLTGLIVKVRQAHGDRHPELAGILSTFAALREELESHLMKEEQILFPLVRRLGTAGAAFSMHCGTVNNPIRVMEHEHDSAGAALERLRWLSDNYLAPADACTSFRALYDALARLEADLHLHIHKENNILFPMAARLERALVGSPS